MTRNQTYSEKLETLGNKVYDTVRAICHLTVGGSAQKPQDVYAFLGNMNNAAGYMMRDAITNMAEGLERAGEVYNIKDYPADQAANNTRETATLMRQAALHAGQIAALLSEAQTKINSQYADGLKPKPKERASSGED
jgi:hypothetical protein